MTSLKGAYGSLEMKITQKTTEADIVAELYYQFRLVGIIPRLEIKLPTLLTKSKKFRVDMVIEKNEEIIAVIEAKRRAKLWNNSKSFKALGREWAEDRQKRVYQRFEESTGIPVIWVIGRKDIGPAINKVIELCR
jgi:hypothetical protein